MNPSWDLFIVLSFVIMAIYGFLLGKNRILSILINSYVALTVSAYVGDYAFQYLSRLTDISHSFNLTLFGAKVFVFVTVLFVLLLNKELSGGGDASNSNIVTAAYGLLTTGLVLSSIFSFMGESEMALLFSNSSLAVRVYNLQILWLTAPILLMISLTIWNKYKR